MQALHAVTLVCRYFQQRVAKFTVDFQQRMQAGAILVVDQVGLVQQQQRAQASVLGSYQVAVDQVRVRLGSGGEHNHDQVDVGGHRLELTVVVRPAQLGAARHLRHDYADALVTRTPHDTVASDQRRQVGAQMAAEHLACGFAILGFNFYLHAKVRDHQAQLLGPQVAAFQFLQRMLLAFGGASGALALDFSIRQFWRRLSWRLAMKVPCERPGQGIENGWQFSTPGAGPLRLPLKRRMGVLLATRLI